MDAVRIHTASEQSILYADAQLPREFVSRRIAAQLLNEHRRAVKHCNLSRISKCMTELFQPVDAVMQRWREEMYHELCVEPYNSIRLTVN